MSKPGINERNPFGIHFLKFVIASSLLTAHSIVWIANAAGETFEKSHVWWPLAHFCSLGGMLIPAAAGAMQRIGLMDRPRGVKLEMAEIQSLAVVLAGLAFLESFKAALVYTPGLFFAWNVLHMLAVSLILILLLARISVLLVWGAGVLCLLMTPVLRAWLDPFQVTTEAQITKLNNYFFPQTVLMILAVLTTVLCLIFLWRSSAIKTTFKLRLTLLALLVFDVVIYFIPHANYNFFFAARLANLPVGALIGDHGGSHYWPLFPWFSTVALGFVLYDLFLRTRHPNLLRWSVLLCGLTLLGVFFFGFADSVYAEFDPRNTWSRDLFAGNLGILTYVVGLFLLKVFVYDRLSTSESVEKWLKRHPFFFKVPLVFSRTILWAYLFVNSVGVALAYPFVRALPYDWAIIVYPIFMNVLWYWIGSAILVWFGTKKFVIQLRKVSQ